MAKKSDNVKPNSYSDKLRILILSAIEDLITVSGPGAGLATESTLLSILNNIISSQDIEILLVRDTGASNKIVQQIREYDQGTGLWTTRYEDVNSAAYTVVGPLEYLDASSVLNLVLSELQLLNTTDFSTETTLTSVLAGITSLDGKDFATETTLLTLDSNVVLGNATLNGIKTEAESLNTPVVGLGTSLLRVTSSGVASVAAGKRRVSFFNAGNSDANVSGGVLKKGEAITFSADGLRDTLAAISYDALTSELVITTVG